MSIDGNTKINADRLICCGLALLAFAVYWQTRQFDFINLDDNVYVYDNPHIRDGLTITGLKWAFQADLVFQTPNADYWQPVTMISRMLDVSLFRLHPGGHHIMNVLLHALNGVLLFLCLRRLTGRRWPSAWVAAMLMVHPMHVESVAWVTERKDVLSACFWILTVMAYTTYARAPSLGKYALVFLPYALGLMTKPMLVTLPCALLLLDVWPLGRLRPDDLCRREARNSAFRLGAEKLPLLLLGLATAGVTFRAAKATGAIQSAEAITLIQRLGTAAVGYGTFLRNLFWPHGLAVLYPWAPPTPETAAVAAAILAVVTALAIWQRNSRPYLGVGWFWFSGVLFPVIGVVQVGPQSLADRFVYIPYIGLYIMLAWAFDDWVRPKLPRKMVAFIAGIPLILAIPATWHQVSFWRNSETLFRHALDVTEGNQIAHNNLGLPLLEAGHVDKAITHFRAAIAIRTDYPEAHQNLGAALLKKGNIAEAILHLETSIRGKPNVAGPYANLAAAHEQAGDLAKAEEHYRTALGLSHAKGDLSMSLGTILARAGKLAGAEEHLRAALAESTEPHLVLLNLGNVLAQRGRPLEAVDCYRKAAAITRGWVLALQRLAWMLAACPDAAVRQPQEALAIAKRLTAHGGPESPILLDTLAIAYAANGDFEQAVKTEQRAIAATAPGGPSAEGRGFTQRLEMFRNNAAYTDPPVRTPGAEE